MKHTFSHRTGDLISY